MTWSGSLSDPIMNPGSDPPVIQPGAATPPIVQP